MLALTDQLAAADGSVFSVYMDSVFWPTIPYWLGALIIFATLVSELDMIALMGGRQAYLKRPSGLLRLALAAVAAAAFWQMTAHSEPIRDSRLFEVLPTTPGALGFLIAAFAFAIVRGDQFSRSGRSCLGVGMTAGGGGLMLVSSDPTETTCNTTERDDTDGAKK